MYVGGRDSGLFQAPRTKFPGGNDEVHEKLESHATYPNWESEHDGMLIT